MSICTEIPTDYPAVYTLNAAAFPTPEEAELEDKLRQSEALIPELSIVAEEDNAWCGTMQLLGCKA